MFLTSIPAVLEAVDRFSKVEVQIASRDTDLATESTIPFQRMAALRSMVTETSNKFYRADPPHKLARAIWERGLEIIKLEPALAMHAVRVVLASGMAIGYYGPESRTTVVGGQMIHEPDQTSEPVPGPTV